MLKHVHLNGCLLGDRAVACLVRLIVGEGQARAYRHCPPQRGDYGYYYEPSLHEWVAFDNRAGSCWVETFRHEHEAKEALYDGN